MTQDEILKIAMDKAGVTIRKENERVYHFDDEDILAFATAILEQEPQEAVAVVCLKQQRSNGATTTDIEKCITTYKSINLLPIGTKLYTSPPSQDARIKELENELAEYEAYVPYTTLGKLEKQIETLTAQNEKYREALNNCDDLMITDRRYIQSGCKDMVRKLLASAKE